MNFSMIVLAIVPARGGSKSIPIDEISKIFFFMLSIYI